MEIVKEHIANKVSSPKLRFKDENGKNYPDWEEKKLGEDCKLQGGNAFKSSLFKKIK